jgi:hypothetical protein
MRHRRPARSSSTSSYLTQAVRSHHPASRSGARGGVPSGLTAPNQPGRSSAPAVIAPPVTQQPPARMGQHCGADAFGGSSLSDHVASQLVSCLLSFFAVGVVQVGVPQGRTRGDSGSYADRG